MYIHTHRTQDGWVCGGVEERELLLLVLSTRLLQICMQACMYMQRCLDMWMNVCIRGDYTVSCMHVNFK